MKSVSLRSISLGVGILLPAAALLAGCSSSSSPATGSGGSGADKGAGGSSGSGATGSGGAAGASGAGSGGDSTTMVDGSVPTSCKPPETGLPATAVCILHIDGSAIDANDKPLAAHTLVSACGPTQCNPGYTAADGKFEIPVGIQLVPSTYAAQVHVRVDKAAFYYPLPTDTKGPVVNLGNLRVLDMPAQGPALNVNRAGVPAQTVTSGDVTLDVPDGTYVRLDLESNSAGDHGKEFRALTIPAKFVGEFAPAALGVKAMYALEPFESSYETPGAMAKAVNVRLTFANTEKLAAGSAVDVLALGTYIYPDWIPPAAFSKVASAHVSADGSKIAFDSGEGVPYLTWFAVRPAQ